MARQPRLHIPGGVYHVMLRGNGGQDIFLSDEDFSCLYLLLQEGTTRFRYRVHGFCCMTNHLHLILQVSDIPLSRVMQNLSFRYTQWINRRCNRRGHLFQGRFKALLVEADSYLLELVRYVHLNPVRCGMVRDPREYAWSSHRAYLGEQTLPWLTTDWVLGQLAQDRMEARRRYANFVLDGLDEGHRKDFHQGAIDRRVLGDDRFLEQIADAKMKRCCDRPTLEQVVAVVCRSYEVNESDLAGASQQRRLTEARAMIAWLARDAEAASLTEVGKRCNRDVGTMSSALRRLEQRAEEKPVVRERMDRLKVELKEELVILEA
jgi:REP element-mobilizing transposase RayT